MTPDINILVVDDSLMSIETVIGILSDSYIHYKFSKAMSGEEALEMVKTKEYSLILLDIEMPGLSGFEVCEKLKADPETSEIPIIFLSADTDVKTIAKGFKLGAVDYVKKPFNSLELMARVSTHIKLYRAVKMIEEQNMKLQHELAWYSPNLFKNL